MEKAVLVVIGAGGIGTAIARRLGPGHCIILGDYSEPELQKATEALRLEGHDVHGHILDVTDYASVQAFAQDAAKAGRLVTVVNTAGVSPLGVPSQTIYNTNLVGTANVIEAFTDVVPPGSSMICIASIAAHTCHQLSPECHQHLAKAPRDCVLDHPEINLAATSPEAYRISKKGVVLRVKAVARAWGLKGARINAVCPGLILTPMSRPELEGPSAPALLGSIDKSALQRIGTPDDVANVVAFLAGPASSYITGTDIVVDGGILSGGYSIL